MIIDRKLVEQVVKFEGILSKCDSNFQLFFGILFRKDCGELIFLGPFTTVIKLLRINVFLFVEIIH